MISGALQVNNDRPAVEYTIVRVGNAHEILGVAADLSHINTNNTVTGHTPTPSGLREALTGADIVLIPAGVPRKPGMTRDGMGNPVSPSFNCSRPRLMQDRPLQYQRLYCP